MCSIAECNSQDYSSGLCSLHYSRLRTTGTTDPGPKARASFEERFWRNVDKRGKDECWPFKLKGVDGYGTINRGGRGGKRLLAHRASWIIHFGEIPESDEYHGTVVRHKCDNRKCVNPYHLELGTQADNVADMDARGGRINSQLKGSKHHNSKLTEQQVLEIRSSSLSNAELGRMFGVTRQAVRYARNNGWAHVKT